MRITLLGVLGILAVAALVVYVAYQLHQKTDQKKPQPPIKYPPPNGSRPRKRPST